MKGAINKLHLFVGFNVLFLGVLYYFFFRTSDSTYFLQFSGIAPHLQETASGIFFTLGQSLPTFIHVFAFSLLTAALVASSKQNYAAVCLFWFGINVLFEFGQKFDGWVIQFIPDFFSDIAFLENTKNYFIKGRFDYVDLFSIILGALAAYIFLLTTTKNGGEK